jgi:hypothetical protein
LLGGHEGDCAADLPHRPRSLWPCRRPAPGRWGSASWNLAGYPESACPAEN